MKRVLFIDRDGTLISEPEDFQVDSMDKLRFMPGMISALSALARESDFIFVMVSNQDGLGSSEFPESAFEGPQKLLIETLAGEGVVFEDIFIDRSKPEDNSPTRKPGTAMLQRYLAGDYDLANSFVIGDRPSDIELARNLGCGAIYLENRSFPLSADFSRDTFIANDWQSIYEYLRRSPRRAEFRRSTGETDIEVSICLEGSARSEIKTGLRFLDHMLEQIPRHAGIDLLIHARGDLDIDEHHTIEDVAITLGEALNLALGDKIGIGRYGFCLPMDDCLAQVAIDFGGRSWLVWEAEFRRERIGDVPTEMFSHFFKSLADSARCNLNIKAEGTNEHHKIEAIFKAFAKSLKMAIRRDGDLLPSTKGII
ncbi:MAG: bifunctional histidinol-phosphatase/imidazoleglycerol-phosphate dehydratase [Blastocatellia bacterium]